MDELAVGRVESTGRVITVIHTARRTEGGHEDISCLAGEPPTAPPRDLGWWEEWYERPVTRGRLGMSLAQSGGGLVGTSKGG